jgi:hypothetical protein
MPRFFFNLYGGEDVVDDPEGEDLADVQAARRQAVVIIRELTHGGGYRDRNWTLVVTAVDGHEFFRIPFAEVRRAPPCR